MLDDGLGLDGSVGSLDESGTAADVHNGRTLHWHGMGDTVGLVHVHGHGDLDDLLLQDRHVIGHLHALLHGVGLVHNMRLLDHADDGGVGGHGALEGSGDSNGQPGGGRLVDGGGIAGDERGLTEVQLLADDRGRLDDGLRGGSGHMSGGIGCRHRHRGGSGDGHGGGGESHGGDLVVRGSSASGGKHGGQNNL